MKNDPSTTIGDLARQRKKHGANTPTGHACSNLIEQLQVLPTYERPAWATHHTQTLPWAIQQQTEALAGLLAAGG